MAGAAVTFRQVPRRLRNAIRQLSGHARLLAVALAVGILGTILLVTTHAATNSVGVELENGTITAPAAQVTDASASSGKAVKFGAVSSGAAISWGWQLTKSNTGLAGAGIDKNSLPTFSGTITAGMTISNKKITSGLDLTNIPNVTLDHVWLQPDGAYRALILGPGTVIKNSDIDGSTMVQGERIGIYGDTSNYTIQNDAIYSISVGAWLDGENGSGSMSGTWIGNMISINGAHMDGFTRRAGSGALTISVCYIDTTGPSSTGAFFMQNTWGGSVTGISVSNTYFAADGYVVLLYDGFNLPVTASFNNIRLSHSQYGPTSTVGQGHSTQWANAYYYDAANPINSTDGGAKGAVVSQP